MYHFPKFWRHKDTKEVIDHQTYSDLTGEHRANFDECDVTGELIQAPAVDEQKEDVPVLPDISKDTPVVDEPVVDEPVVDEPVVDEPVVDEPVVDEPVVDEPVVDEPVVDEPVVDEPETAEEEI